MSREIDTAVRVMANSPPTADANDAPHFSPTERGGRFVLEFLVEPGEARAVRLKERVACTAAGVLLSSRRVCVHARAGQPRGDGLAALRCLDGLLLAGC